MPIHAFERELKKSAGPPRSDEIAPVEPTKLATQTVGNMGLYFVCFRLSQFGWNAMPTARNARGIDVLAYSQDGRRVVTVQVKALSSRNAVLLGTNLDSFIAEFVVVCRKVRTSDPESFVLTKEDVTTRAHRGGTAEKVTYWLETKSYEGDEFRERWERIGLGF